MRLGRRPRNGRGLALTAALGFALAGPAGAPRQKTTLDDFEAISAWQAAPSTGVRLALSSAEGLHGRGLRLDFDFNGRAGWAAAHREIAIDLPDNYEVSFAIRGQGPPNDLEIKWIDSSGENVWWAVRRDFKPPDAWQTIRLKKRHFSFAWGPLEGGEIRHVAALEFVVTARSGGAGWIALDDLTLTPLPPPAPPSHLPSLTASSSSPRHDPARAMDGDPSTAWESGAPGPAWLQIDFGERREFGGLTITWEPTRFAGSYEVETSDDGDVWTPVRRVNAGNGGRDDLYLPESESRYVRLDLHEGEEGAGFGICEIVVQPLSYSESPNAFFEAIARDSPRGAYPRSFSGEQSYWTVVGVDGDTENALLSEDGAVEPSQGAFSVEPFLWIDGRLLSWSDVEIRHRLEGGDLPIPTVVWRDRSVSLEITAFAVGPPGRSSLMVRYRVASDQGGRRKAKLFLAVRPFQVNPPTQFLNGAGGVSPIHRISCDGAAVSIDGQKRIFARVSPSGFGFTTFDGGPLWDFLRRGALPAARRVEDSFGYASGLVAFDLDLSPGRTDEVSLELPIHPGPTASPRDGPASRSQARAGMARQLASCARGWREKLGRVRLVAPAATTLLHTLRTNLAYILIERDGPALRPGTRAYARSWIRDGTLMSDALLRMGHPGVVRAYADWFARYQEADGRMPCCVDRRGADPVVENDSHGELLELLADYGRFTHDTNFLLAHFGNVERGVGYIDALAQSSRTPQYRAPERLADFGLLPESISHEGYSARPVHSYWDDFWAVAGLRGAIRIAALLGREDERARWSGILDRFERDLFASLDRTIASRGIDYIPGSVELADFDPTSTTIALDPAGEAARLPRKPLLDTFERYFDEFVRRGDGRTDWDAYTPYEMRTIGTLVRLGWRDRIPRLLEFFLAGRRPAPWNQWAEVVGRRERKPRFVGDMPHAWVGADFIRSALDLFAYERARDRALVLAAGIPAAWLAGGRPVGVQRLRTPYGPLTYSMRSGDNGLRLSIAGGLEIPPGGLALRPPWAVADCRVTINGKRIRSSGEEIVVRSLPADVLFEEPGKNRR